MSGRFLPGPAGHLNGGDCLKAREDLILRNLAGEYVLMPRGEAIKSFHGTVVMNELSAFVWKQLSAPMDRDALLEAILQEYDVDRETAAADLDGLLARFRELGIVEDD